MKKIIHAKIFTRALLIACLWGIPVSGFQTLQKLAITAEKPHIRTLAEIRPEALKPEPVGHFGAWMGPLPAVLGREWQDSIEQGRLSVSFHDSAWFKPGTTELSSDGISAVEQIYHSIHALPIDSRSISISIEAHSDSTPVVRLRQKYPTNWELSSARALTVLHQLKALGFASQKLAATGFADSRPVSTEMHLNRRMKFKLEFNPLSIGHTQVAQRSF